MVMLLPAFVKYMPFSLSRKKAGKYTNQPLRPFALFDEKAFKLLKEPFNLFL